MIRFSSNYLLVRLLICYALCSLSACTQHAELENLDKNWKLEAEHVELIAITNLDYQYLLEDVEFTLHSFNDPDLVQTKEIFTKLIWEVPEIGIRYKLFDNNIEDPSRARVIANWVHGFTKPGVFNSNLLGYRDNKLIYRSNWKFVVSYKTNGEFMYFDWKDIPYHRNIYISTNLLPKEYPFFYYFKNNLNGLDCLDLHYTTYAAIWNPTAYKSFIEDDQFNDLYSLMFHTYGYPKWSNRNPEDDIQTIHRELFPYQEQEMPQYIWESDHMYAVLLQIHKPSNDGLLMTKNFVRLVQKNETNDSETIEN